MLGLLSALPWSRMTGGRMSDFSLFSDLVGESASASADEPVVVNTALEAEIAEVPQDTVVAVTEPEAVAEVTPVTVSLAEAPVVDGHVRIECYGPAMLPKFRAALAQAGNRVVRVAVLGDSYIEADILTQDLRRLLQERYGGQGVGYMAMHSDFPGFRKSVRQSDSGWDAVDTRTMKRRDSLRTLANEYALSQGARSSYTATSLNAGTQGWQLSRFIFMCGDSATVKLTTDAGEQCFDVLPSDSPQCLSVGGATTTFAVDCPAGISALGAYLDGVCGIAVDCMSVRGNSGLPLRAINSALCSAMRQWVDYDLIILEYGTNAMSAGQTDYSGYGNAIRSAIRKVAAVYPSADILMLGVGDRGCKQGADIVSMNECVGMINAQRAAASATGIHFFDVKAAQGGDGAAAQWRSRRLLNADYIHINHDGGAVLARELFCALMNE